MALFGNKKEKKVVSESAKKDLTLVVSRDISSIIMKPVISEKAAIMGDKNIYTFQVARSATKYDVRDAVKKLWNVTPVRINMVNRVPRQFVRKSRNRIATHPGMKKAYVYLKEGDRIELV